MLLITGFRLPPRDVDKPFLMPVEDVFSITGRGTVATGRIETGRRTKWVMKFEILGLGAMTRNRYVPVLKCSVRFLTKVKLVITLVCCFVVSTRMKSNVVWYLAKPGSVKPHAKFKAEVYILKKEEGGRHTPFHNRYRPQFYIRTLGRYW